jgi:hypothetical protein
MVSRVGLAFVTASLAACVRREPPPNAEKHFVGSEKCASCHQDVYNRWKDTLMAKVIQDPAKHPEAIVADFSTPNPLVTFRKEDIAFTYGTKWKQRYFSKRGDDYYVFPAQWDVRAKSGDATSWRTAPTGGRSTIRPIRCSGRRARCATAVIRSTTTSKPKQSPSGTLAVRSATGPAVFTSSSRSPRPS